MSLDLVEVRFVMHAPVVTLREQMRLGDVRWALPAQLAGWQGGGRAVGGQVLDRLGACLPAGHTRGRRRCAGMVDGMVEG